MTDFEISTLNLPPAPTPPALWRRIFSFANIVTALFLAVCGTLIFRHAMWIDEAQAFLIARDSHSLSDLLVNMRYEGHPPLWHLLLFILTRFTTNPVSMQVLHLLLATTTVYLVARFSPFPYVARFLFAFGYFPLFEYGVISRNYQLVMLLTMAFCSFWQYRRTAYVRLSILLGLMCLSHVLGLIIAAGLGVVLLMDSLVTREGRGSIRKNPYQYIFALAIAGGLAALTIKLVQPPPDGDFHPEWRFDFQQMHLLRTFTFAWDGLVHIPPCAVNFWKPPLPVNQVAAAAHEGIVALLAAILLLCNSWRAILFFLIAVGGQLAFFHFKFDGSTRHHGEMFTALIGAFWIAWAIHGANWKPSKTPGPRLLSWVPRLALIAVLGVHVYAAGIAVYYIWKVPFTAAKEAGLALQQAIKPGDLVFADEEILSSSVAIYVPGHPFYFPARDRWGTFTIWSAGVYNDATRKNPKPQGMAAAQRMANERHATVFYIAHNDNPRVPVGVTKLGWFHGGLSDFETYAIYRIPPASAQSSSAPGRLIVIPSTRLLGAPAAR